MISLKKIFHYIVFILASILLSIPVSLVLISLYFNISYHNNELNIIKTFSNYFYIFKNFGLEVFINQLIQKKIIPIIIFIAFLPSMAFVTICFKSREKPKELIHISGPKLYKGKAAIRHAQSMHKKDLIDNNLTSSGIKIHPKIQITNLREENNFLILGTTGAGKSTAFKPLVQQAIERGDYAVIYDEAGALTEAFYNADTSILLAPWDKRGAYWDISDDIETKEDAELLAKCLIPDSKSPDPLWDSGARIILISMIMTLINTKKKAWGWEDIYKQLTFSPDQARSIFVKHHPLADSLLTPNSKTTTSFYVHIMTKLSWVQDLAKAWPNQQNNKTFSLKKWITEDNEKHVVIIQANSQFESIGEPLCNAVISFMTKHFLDPNNSTKRKTWLFIDEFANLPRNPSILKWLALGRARGARSVLCTQSISQIHNIYGEKETHSMLSLLSNVITFRMGAAGSDAEDTAKIYGLYDAEEPNYENPDNSGKRSSEPLVKTSDLVHLSQPTRKGVEGYMQIPSWHSAYKLRWPLFKPTGNAEKVIPAQWLTNSVSQRNTQPKVKQQGNRLNKRKNK
ncbi:type IV secretion system DNA-binding domain-containing protein [Marinomonas sp. ef1]|uniref:type IV secretion system DNA-binding domain-containing protein n=1 Tax=Marinomonas sp. ef1 TaxID=2005043 RepID=UPI000C281E9B|nr:type IV secretion system DNA-binding domain-containing protein [Marinomonas sp. ef1]